MNEQRSNPARRRTYRAGQLVIAAVECYALAECVWYVVTDGQSHLYELAAEKWTEFRKGVEYRAQILDTLRFIRRLPER